MPKKARILVMDIETSPLKASVWGKWVDGPVIEVIEDWFVLCFAYKWVGEKKTYVVAQNDFVDYEKDRRNDYSVVLAMWELLDEADIVVGHNSMSFDIKKMNARFIQHGFIPPSSYQQVDTLRVAKQQFRFTSNKLGDIGKLLGVGGKAETGGYDTWKGCMAGDKKAWARMKRYNKQDVVLTESVYLTLLPWMPSHPSLSNIENRPNACPKCGAEGSMSAQGVRKTQTATYQRFVCTQCGGWCRARIADKTQKVTYV